jgi:hypothetical protein
VSAQEKETSGKKGTRRFCYLTGKNKGHGYHYNEFFPEDDHLVVWSE